MRRLRLTSTSASRSSWDEQPLIIVVSPETLSAFGHLMRIRADNDDLGRALGRALASCARSLHPIPKKGMTTLCLLSESDRRVQMVHPTLLTCLEKKLACGRLARHPAMFDLLRDITTSCADGSVQQWGRIMVVDETLRGKRTSRLSLCAAE